MWKNGVSIIIVNYNSAKDIKVAIESFKKYESNYYKENLLEFIIVDNDSAESDICILNDIKNEYNNVKIVKTYKNNGFGKGNNIGVNISKYENLIFFNADAYLKDKLLDKVIDISNDANIGIVGVQLLNRDGSKQVSCGYFPSVRQSLMELCGLYKINKFFQLTKPFAFSLPEMVSIIEVDYVSGACFFMKKDLFKKVSGFDEKFFLYYEETDLCRRVLQYGLKVIIIQSKSVVHLGSSSTGQFSKFKAKCFYESYIRFIKKHNKNYKVLYLLNKIIVFEKKLISNIIKNKAKENYYKKALEVMKENID